MTPMTDQPGANRPTWLVRGGLRGLLRCIPPTIALFLASGCAPSGPSAPEPASRPHLVLVSLDTTRADRCSVYGYSRPTTPFLEQLATESTTFEVAYAPMATTGPSHASLFTSLYPRSHGFVKNGMTLTTDRPTMSEILRDAGYRTAAFVSAFPVSARFGFGRGFEVYDEPFSETSELTERWEGVPSPRVFERPGRETARRAAAWMANLGGDPSPVLLWVHIFDPHHPYEPSFDDIRNAVGRSEPDPAAVDFSTRYDGELRAADDATRIVFEGADRFLRTRPVIRIVVGDHGEGLMDHGHMEHGIHLYEEAVRVPLLLSFPPAVPAGFRVTAPVEMLDILPTVLELAGLNPPTGIEGKSLAGPLLDRTALPEDRAVYLQRRRYQEATVSGFHIKGDLTAIRKGSWKLLSAPDENLVELYHLETDPEERRNLAEERSEVHARLALQLREWEVAHPSSHDVPADIDPEVIEMLRALGYEH